MDTNEKVFEWSRDVVIKSKRDKDGEKVVKEVELDKNTFKLREKVFIKNGYHVCLPNARPGREDVTMFFCPNAPCEIKGINSCGDKLTGLSVNFVICEGVEIHIDVDPKNIKKNI